MDGIPEIVKALQWVMRELPCIAIISVLVLYIVTRREASKD